MEGGQNFLCLCLCSFSPREMWVCASNLHVTRTSYPTAPRPPVGPRRWWCVAQLGSHPHFLTAFGAGGAATWGGSTSPRPRAYHGQVQGHKGTQRVVPCRGHGGGRQPMCDPEGCSTVWGAVGGGDPTPLRRGGGTPPPPLR